MKAIQLVPRPQEKRPFRANQHFYIPEQGGCYVLSTFDETIVYIGLSKNLSRRFDEHLDSPKKTEPTRLGRAVWFHWLICKNLEQVERTWLNAHEISEGELPCLNKHHSPLPM